MLRRRRGPLRSLFVYYIYMMFIDRFRKAWRFRLKSYHCIIILLPPSTVLQCSTLISNPSLFYVLYISWSHHWFTFNSSLKLNIIWKLIKTELSQSLLSSLLWRKVCMCWWKRIPLPITLKNKKTYPFCLGLSL